MINLRSQLMCLLMVAGLVTTTHSQTVPMTLRWDRDLKSFIEVFAISHDGSTIIAGNSGGGIILFDALTGDSIGAWQAHDKGITSIDASPVKDMFATCSNSEIRVWSLSERRMLKQIPVEVSIPNVNKALALSHSGTYVALEWGGTGYAVFNVSTGARLYLNEYGYKRANFLANETQLLLAVNAGPSNHVARVVDIATGATVAEFTVSAKWIRYLTASSNGRYLLIGVEEGTASIYDMVQRKIVWTKYVQQSDEDGQWGMLSPSGNHVLLSRIAEGITGTHLIHWSTDMELGRSSVATRSGRLAPDSSYFVDGFQTSLFKVSMDWPATGVNDAKPSDTIRLSVLPSTRSILLTFVPSAIATFQWTLSDVSGRRVAAGQSLREGETFHISPNPVPTAGVYILQCSSATGLLGAWTISLN